METKELIEKLEKQKKFISGYQHSLVKEAISQLKLLDNIYKNEKKVKTEKD